MTDRIKGLTVAFTADIREDDAQCIIDAILMIKGVANVTTSLSSPGDYINRQMVKSIAIEKILKFINEI